MQLSGDAALAAAVAGDSRTIVFRFEVDWNRNGLYDHALSNLTSVVQDLRIQRDTNSSLPPETTLIDGYQAARMDVRLGARREGDTATILRVLSMWNTSSVLYGDGRSGVPVRAFIGHRLPTGVETTPQQFAGRISEFRADSGPATISMTCLDGIGTLKKSIDLPAFALAPDSVKVTGLNLFLKQNCQWVIDYIFRQNGYYMTPPPPDDVYTFFAATLHGSPAPEIGHQSRYWIGDGALAEDMQPYGPGRPGWGLSWGGRNWYGVISYRGGTTSFRPVSGRSLTIQFQVDTTKANPPQFSGQNDLVMYCSGNGYLAGTSVLVSLSNTRDILVQFYDDITLVRTVTVGPLGSGWVDCWVNIAFNGATSSVSWPSGTVSSIDLSALPANPSVSRYPHVYLFAQLPMSDLQMTNSTSIAAASARYNPATWVTGADVDTSLNDITGLPLRRGVNSLDLLKEVVGAEYGVAGFSEAGRPFFRNRDTVRRGSLTTVKDTRDTKEITGLAIVEREDAIRNQVSYSYAQRLMSGPADNPKSWDIIYSQKEATEILLPPGITSVNVILDQPTARVDAYVPPSQFTSAQWSDPINVENIKNGFVTTTPDGAAVTSGITALSVTPMSPQDDPRVLDRVIVIFNNTTNNYVHFKTTDGSPAFQLRGNRYYFSPPVNQVIGRSGSIARYGERMFEIPTSEWHQLDSSLRRVADSLLRDLASPVPIVDQFAIVGDCRLQLQDSLSVVDTAGLGGPVNCSIVGINRQLTIDQAGARLTDQLQVRPSSAPGRWILGHSVWGVLGQTTKL